MPGIGEAVERIRQENKTEILVTGPQRSGTTIVARILAHELGLDYVDEDDIDIDDYDKARAVMRRGNVVLQAPGLCHIADLFETVVLVKRPVEDVAASQKRINWRYEGYEKDKYRELLKHNPWLPISQGLLDGFPIAVIKYHYWQKWQRKEIERWFGLALEVDYDSLEGHPLWVPREQRLDFARRQWSLHF